MRFKELKTLLENLVNPKLTLLDEEVLDEVKMSPSALKKFADSPEAEGMLMGIEFEMCVPNVAVDDDSGEGEYDYDMDERAYSIDDIVDFFRNGDMATLSSSGADRLRNEMWDQYLDWQSGAIADNIDEDELNDRVRDRLKEDLDVNDYMDDAAEELGIDPTENDENEAKVRERAEELLDEYLDEELMGNSRDYERAYDDIRQEMEDEMRDDGDYDQEAWLRDIGIDYMSEAEREWSLDWPHWLSYNDGGDLDVDTVGDEFGRAMGLDNVNTSSNYHGARRDGKNWIIEPDSSIDADSGDGGLEFVSPPMPIKDGIEMIEKMYAWAKKEGCYTNRSTGLHMNISVPDMTIESLDYVKLALFLGDEYVLKQFGREYNNYCKSAMSKIKDRIRPEDVGTVLNTMKQHLNSLASKTIHSGITDKYTSINTKSNYVEFRGPGGDYLDKDPFEVINTALRLAMSLRIATNPEAYKQEYAKKLYKLVEQGGDPDEAVQLFSKYAVGELPKEDLIARIKFARKEREIKKDKKDHVSRMMDNPQVKDKVKDLPFKWRQHLRDNLGDASEQQLQSLINNINGTEYDEELTPEQRDLVSSIVANELEWRKAQGEKKAYWVFNKDGSGGKQLVYAHTENEAILKGGSQMGMKREESITKLRAEEKVEEPASADTVQGGGRKKYSQDVKNVIDSMDAAFDDFVRNIPTKSNETLAAVIRKAADGEYDDSLTREQLQLLVLLIDDEKAFRAANGEVPAASGTELEFQTGEPAVDEPSLPTNWDDWIRTIQSQETSTLNNVARMVRQGGNEVINSLTDSDREYLLDRIRQEIERRATDSNADTDVMRTLPEMYQAWLGNITTYPDATLINTLNNPAATSDLSEQQAAFFRIKIKHELRRRGIDSNQQTTSDEPAQPAQQELDFSSPDDETIDDIMGGDSDEQDAAVAQQSQLINRDDPVTSNDSEAQSPIAGQGDEAFEIYNPETMQIIASVQQATLDYAIQKARQHEQDLNLDAGTLKVRSIGSSGVSESINMLRRLAGIR